MPPYIEKNKEIPSKHNEDT